MACQTYLLSFSCHFWVSLITDLPLCRFIPALAQDPLLGGMRQVVGPGDRPGDEVATQKEPNPACSPGAAPPARTSSRPPRSSGREAAGSPRKARPPRTLVR